MKRNEDFVNEMFARISVGIYQCELIRKELDKLELGLKETSESMKLLYHRVARESKPMRRKRGKNRKTVNKVMEDKPKRGRPAKKKRGRPKKV